MKWIKSAIRKAFIFCWCWLKKAIVATGLLVIAIALVVTIFPDSTLSWVAETWSVAEAPRKADAIFVLGGGNGFRPQAAAEIWKSGEADLIYVFQPVDKFGAQDSSETVDILVKNGVSESQIRKIEAPVMSTFDEAVSVGKIVKMNGYESILIPTHLFHTRRVQWIFSKHVECELVITEAPYQHFRAEDWWKNEWGLFQFPSEVLKTVFYLLRY